MPKAVLSNRIFLEASKELSIELSNKLTYKIPSNNPEEPPTIIRNFSVVKDNLVSIPIGRTDLIPSNYEVVDKRIENKIDFPVFQGTLRDSQKEIYEQINDNAMINAWVSFGKTFTALAIAEKWQQKTLVVVHNTSLRTQWINEIKKVFGVTPGIIGSGKFNIDSPIVVGNVQSLYTQMAKLYSEFGCLIIDEMHRTAAPTFTKIVNKSAAKYKLGLSATLERKDGKHVVFKDYFGFDIHKPAKENCINPTIHLYDAPFKLPEAGHWAVRINKLSEDQEYKNYICYLTTQYKQLGHKVLVIGERIGFLKSCAELLNSFALSVTGEITYEQREEIFSKIKNGDKSVIFGTRSIFAEGISIDELSCIVLATPINNRPLLTQLIGRIMRVKEEKLPPVVVDVQLKGNTAIRQAKERINLYTENEWKIKVIKN